MARKPRKAPPAFIAEDNPKHASHPPGFGIGGKRHSQEKGRAKPKPVETLIAVMKQSQEEDRAAAGVLALERAATVAAQQQQGRDALGQMQQANNTLTGILTWLQGS